MKKIIAVLFLFTGNLLNGQIISQYIDTNSGTEPKGIEIFNNTTSDLDFTTNNLVVEKGVNGDVPSVDFTLSSGTLAIGAVLVIGSSNLQVTTENNGATFYLKPFTFNGDDALVIKYGGTVTDIFGLPGSDPGSSWTGSGVSTADQNIALKYGITIGDLNGWTDPSLRFTLVSSDPVGTNGDEGFGNPDPPLPVELTTFSASVVDNNIELNWETATEVNNYGFNIERASTSLSMTSSRAETREWETLGFVNGHGNSNSPKYYDYTDNTIEASGKYFYRLKQVDIDGTFEYSDAIEVNFGAPSKFELNQNFPNPFNPTTSIQFSLPQDSQVRLSVFNILGEEVAELINNNIAAGYHNITFNASELNSGIYFYKLETNNFTQIRKMMLVK